MIELLKVLSKEKASDLHIKAGNKPFLRIDGELVPIEGAKTITKEDIKKLGIELMNDKQINEFERSKEVDFAVQGKKTERFRVNIFKEKGNTSIVIRRIGLEDLSFDELNLPEVLKKLSDLPRGLILVTGTAGSGKTTTIAAMLDYINETRRSNIITIEDPIEILHTDKQSIISQRELGIDTNTYAQALRHVVRQDPDVIFIGEIRDRETIDSALKSSELGNLVFSTLHTIDATETINRVIDMYPAHQQKQIRIILASALAAVVSLRLLPKVDGGLIPAVEILVMNNTVKKYLLNPDETYLMRKAMEDGEYYGMTTFDKSLIELLKKNKISKDNALSATPDKHDFEIKIAHSK